MNKVTCPICKGVGEIDTPNSLGVDSVTLKRSMAKKLHEAGYSIRQIQKVMGYKSPRSIQVFIKSK